MKNSLNNKKSNIVKNISITFISRVLIFVLSFSISIIIARVLGPKLRGIYALTLLIPMLMLKLGSLGIEASNIYFTGSKKFSIKQIIFNSLFLGILIGIFLILIFYISIKFRIIKNFVIKNQIDYSLLWLVIFSTPFSLIFLFTTSVILGKEKIRLYNGLNVLRYSIQLAFIIIFVIVLKLLLKGAILSYVISVLIVSITCVLIIGIDFGIQILLNKNLIVESIKYGLKAYFGNIAQFLNYRLDMFLVAAFLNPINVGYYSVAVGIAEKIWMIPGAVSTVLFPKVSNIKDIEANNLTPRVVRHTFFIVTCFSIILAFFAHYFIKLLYGALYLPSVKPLLILLPGIIALSGSKAITADLAGRGKPQYGAYSSFISLGVNIPLNILLIPKWGISGAAFASSIAYIVASIIVLSLFLRLCNCGLLNVLILKYEDIEGYKKIFLKLIKKD